MRSFYPILQCLKYDEAHAIARLQRRAFFNLNVAQKAPVNPRAFLFNFYQGWKSDMY